MRDPAVDDQPLDLVEHRHVRGVGRVAAEHPPRHHHVDRRRLASPSRGSAPATCACAAGRCPARRTSANRVSHIAPRRVRPGHVERLEVVPVALHLGALGDLEAEADEHVLEPLPRLGDDVGVAPSGAHEHLGEVECARRRAGRRARRRPAHAQALVDRGGHRRRRPRWSAWPAALRSSTVASAPSCTLKPANGPFLPSSSASSARVVEPWPRRSGSTAASRARHVIDRSSREPFVNLVAEWADPPAGQERADVSESARHPGRPGAPKSRASVIGQQRSASRRHRCSCARSRARATSNTAPSSPSPR